MKRNMGMAGKLYGVGVGPGDPKLITLRGVEAIKAADVIAVPNGEGAESSRALKVIEALIDPARQEILSVPFSTKRDKGAAEALREAAYRAVAERLIVKQQVAVAVLGDPMLYSSFI